MEGAVGQAQHTEREVAKESASRSASVSTQCCEGDVGHVRAPLDLQVDHRMKHPAGMQHGLLILDNLTAGLQISVVLPDAQPENGESENAKQCNNDAHVQ